ncbi:MAG TPA: S24/S26 family peptidase [Myxococcota bacterium]|nr:S24/S26 family peptidase [Myxococcota bacterium]
MAAGRAARPELVALLRTALAAGPLELVAHGVSMRPALRPGDRVRLEARAPRRGEIVLAVAGRRLVLHRVLRRRGEKWLLRGDARRCPDGWIPGDDVLGVATARATTGGRAQGWKRLDGGMARAYGLFIVPFVALMRRVPGRRWATQGRMRPLSRLRKKPSAKTGRARQWVAIRGSGFLDGARDRAQSAGRAPPGER